MYRKHSGGKHIKILVIRGDFFPFLFLCLPSFFILTITYFVIRKMS